MDPESVTPPVLILDGGLVSNLLRISMNEEYLLTRLIRGQHLKIYSTATSLHRCGLRDPSRMSPKS